jgi:hypothetical protein
MSFKAGDRVRLKARPETVGALTEPAHVPEDGELYIRWDEGAASGWRYPEELELIPSLPEEYVGKVVRFSRHGDHWLVLGVDPADGWLVVRKVGHGHEYYAVNPLAMEVVS